MMERKNRVGTRYFVNSDDEIISKVCRMCSEVKLIAEFNRAKKGLGGRQADCKKCHSSYHYKDRDRNLTKKRQWYQANRERVLEVNRRWQEEHSASVTEYKRQWLLGNRAEKAALVNNWTEEERHSALEFFGGCALTGAQNFEWDHVIPITSGYGGTTAGNMMPLTRELNASKSNRNIFEWFDGNHERLGLNPNKFDKLISYLAKLNEMTREEYRNHVDSCFKNKNEESIVI